MYFRLTSWSKILKMVLTALMPQSLFFSWQSTMLFKEKARLQQGHLSSRLVRQFYRGRAFDGEGLLPRGQHLAAVGIARCRVLLKRV